MLLSRRWTKWVRDLVTNPRRSRREPGSWRPGRFAVELLEDRLAPAAATHYVISAPATATAGTSFTFTVTAEDDTSATDTGYTGTVHFTSSDGNPTLPGDATLTNGTGSFTATLRTAGNQTITGTDTVDSSITGTSNAVAVSAAPATHFAVSAPATATAGTAFNFTVTALDPFNNTDTAYAGTVHFSSSDAAATVPADSTLTNGTGTFSITLRTAGNQPITATDTVTSSITGTTTVGVNAAPATHFAVIAPATATAGSAFNFTVTALDQFNNTDTGYTGTVHFTSSDGNPTLPANSSLTNGAGTFSATLRTAGNQTITATDTVTSSITGTSNTIGVSAAAATHFAVSAPATATAGSAFNFTVTALDPFNNTATAYTGTVHFTSSDGNPTLPADSSLTNGAGTFSATLRTAGNQTLTATDTVTSSITGTATVGVSAAAATHFAVSAPATATIGSAFTFTVTALDPFNNTDTTYAGTIHFTSSDAAATVPADSTLTNGAGTFSATLATAGNQTLTATDTVTSSITGTSNPVSVSSVLPVAGSGVNDTLVVTATGPDSGFYTLNGGPPVPFNGVTSFSFTGGAGNDTMTVNNPPGGLFAPAGGISFDGGTQAGGPGDSLVIQGGQAVTETITFTPDSGGSPHSGTIALVNGGTTASYSFSNLSPILVNAGTPDAAIFNLPTGDGNNQAILTDDGGPGDPDLTNDPGFSAIVSGNGSFEYTQFANPATSLTVNTGNDGETLTVARMDAGFAPAAGIDVVAGTGADTLALDFSGGVNVLPPAGVNFTGAGGNDGIVLQPGYAATRVDDFYTSATDGSINVDGPTLTYTGISPTIGIRDSLAATARDFFFPATNDNITLGDDATAGDGMSAVTSSASSPNTVFANPSSVVAVNAGDGADVVNAGPLDTLGATPSVNLNGLDGTSDGNPDGPDTFNVTPSALSTFFVDGDQPLPPPPGDTLNVNLAGATGPVLAVTQTPTGLSGSYLFTNRQQVNFQEIEGLTPSSVDLSVTKTDGQTTATPGTPISYTVVVANNSPLGVAGVNVADTFPAALTNVSFTSTTTGGAFGNTGSGTGNINDTVTLPPGSSITYLVTATIASSATGTLTNTATVAAPAGVTDTDLANNSSTDSDTLTPSADLGVTKTDSPDPVVAGGNLTYTISVTNAGPSDAQTVTVTDTVPAGETIQTATAPAGGSFGIAGNTVTFTLPTLAAGGSAVGTIVVTVATSTPAGTTLSNTATVSSGTTDNNPANDSSTQTTGVTTSADLSVTKTDSPDPVSPGDDLTYTITVDTAGPSDAQTVQLSDVLPANTTFVSFVPPAGWTTTTPAVGGTGTVTATIGTLPAGSGSQVFTLVVRVNPSTPTGTTLSNAATVGSATPDATTSNNTATQDTTVATAADVGVVKTGPATGTAGTQVTYTLTVTNSGPSDAQGVQLTDTLPAGETFVSASEGTGSGTNFTDAIGPLASGASRVVTVVALIAPSQPAGILTDTASVSTTTPDGNATNDTATFDTTVTTSADVGVAKTGGSTVVAGQNITYTITVSNTGPSDAQSVTFSDVLPAGTTFVSATQDSGPAFTLTTPLVFGTGTLTGTIATLPAGANAGFTLVVAVAASTPNGTVISNTVTETSTTADTNPANATATASTTVATTADLSVTKTDSPDPVLPNRDLTYTIGVANAGPADALNVSLTDAVPAGTTFVSFTAPAGWVTTTPAVGGTGTVTATLTTFPAAEPLLPLEIQRVFFTLVVHTNPSTTALTVTNTATVSTTTQDSNPANDSATATTVVRPAPLPIVVGAGAGGGPEVKVYDPTTGALEFSFFAYDPSFTGGVRVAAGDVTGDGIPDIITGPGPGGGPIVRVFDGATGQLVRSFFAYDPSFRDGVFVAAGDLDGGGIADIVVGPDKGGGPQVVTFNGRTGAMMNSFFAYEPTFRGGVSVAAGDRDGDGRADIITGALDGGGARVRVFRSPDLADLLSVYAYDPAIRGGVYVAAGDIDGDGRVEILTGDAKTSPEIKVFDGDTSRGTRHFFVFDPEFRGGARVAMADFGGDGKLDLVATPGPGGGPEVRVFDPIAETPEDSFMAFSSAFAGGVYVG